MDGVHTAVGTRALMEDENVSVPAASDSQSYSEVMVATAGRLIGSIHIVDVLRPEAAAAIAEIRAMGYRTVLLTGDRKEVGDAIAKALGVDQVDSGLLPEEKVNHVRAMRAQGKKIAMVGDGVNDAPALLEANVGIAMGSGTDVARESASVVLLGTTCFGLPKCLKFRVAAVALFWPTLPVL